MDSEYHFIGIGGVGMSALASILLEQNKQVSGSDLGCTPTVAALQNKGATVFFGQSKDNLMPINKNLTIVYSSGILQDNPEIKFARDNLFNIKHRSELLAELVSNKKTSILVAGSHGKTSTSSLLSHVLMHANKNPSIAIGGFVNGINGKHTESDYFVAEADESDGTLSNYTATGAIVTNIDSEHMNHYHVDEALDCSFKDLFNRLSTPELTFVCSDNDRLMKVAPSTVTTYGFDKNSNLIIDKYSQDGWVCYYDIIFEGKKYDNIKINLPGKHYVSNSAAVFGLALRLGCKESDIRRAFETFTGVGARCEKKFEVNGTIFMDDYAHHPTEISCTIQAIKAAITSKKLIIICQPHRQSRLKSCFNDFTTAFDKADEVWITDVYSPKDDQNEEKVSILDLVKQINSNSNVKCKYVSRSNIVDTIKQEVRPLDVVVTMGAGDLKNIHAELKGNFEPKKYKIGLVFGGESVEHEISILSARNFHNYIDKKLFDIEYFAIDKKGLWVAGEEAEDILIDHREVSSENAKHILSPAVISLLCKNEVLVPILHGSKGENGVIQGFFNAIGIPFTGSSSLCCAMAMNKAVTKLIAQATGISVLNHIEIQPVLWLNSKEFYVNQIKDQIKFPCIVKPMNLGSSVCLKKIYKEEDLFSAIDEALQIDSSVMVEEFLLDAKELEFFVLGNSDHEIKVFSPMERDPQGSVCCYNKKYCSGISTLKYVTGTDLVNKGIELVKNISSHLRIDGMARIDLFVDKDEKLYFLEANPIPGFTENSSVTQMLLKSNYSGSDVFNKLISLALYKTRRDEKHSQLVNQDSLLQQQESLI